MSAFNTDLLPVFATALVVLIFKAQALAVATSLTRVKIQRFLIAEDAAMLKADHAYPDDERVFRVFRAHQNDLEALLPFFIGGALYVTSGASTMIGGVYFAIFVLARVGHTFGYLGKRPLLRRNAFALAWLLNMVIAGHALWCILF